MTGKNNKKNKVLTSYYYFTHRIVLYAQETKELRSYLKSDF